MHSYVGVAVAVFRDCQVSAMDSHAFKLRRVLKGHSEDVSLANLKHSPP